MVFLNNATIKISLNITNKRYAPEIIRKLQNTIQNPRKKRPLGGETTIFAFDSVHLEKTRSLLEKNRKISIRFAYLDFPVFSLNDRFFLDKPRLRTQKP